MIEFISDNLLMIILIAGVVIFVAVFFMLWFRQCKQVKAEQKENNDIENMFIDPETVTEKVKATVVDMVCYTKMVGFKRPKSKRVFIVYFETENGEVLKINVPEEMYDGFDKGQTGTLTLVDGILYGFSLE